MMSRSKQSDESNGAGSPDRRGGAPSASSGFDNSLPTWGWALLLGCLAFLLGAKTLAFGFAYDDFWTILDNHYLHSSYGFAGLFDRTAASLAVPDAGRPVMVAIHWIEWRLFGARSSPYHVVDLIVHSGTVALVFLVLTELTRRRALAGAAALLFAAHPLHAEVLAVTSFREDSLVTFFGLAWWAVLLAAQRPWGQSRTRLARSLQVVAALLFALAVGSKESGAALLPGVWLATAAARGKGPLTELKETPWGYGAAAAALLGLLLFRAWSFGTLAPYSGPLYPHPGDLWHADLLTRMGLAAKATILGLGRFLWPLHLAPEYCLLGAPSRTVALGWILLGSALALVPFWVWQRAARSSVSGSRTGSKAVLASGLLFGLVTFAPTSNLFWMPNTEADRFWYLPSVGLVLVLAVAADWAARELAGWGRRAQERWTGRDLWWTGITGRLARVEVWFWLLVLPALFALAAQLVHHLPVYRNDPTLWAEAWDRAPCSPRAAVGAGAGLLNEGHPHRAATLARRAMGLRPSFPPAIFLLAQAAEAQGRFSEAFRLYDRALRNGYWQPWLCHLGMARVLLAVGNVEGARGHAGMARLLAPHEPGPNLVAFRLAWGRGDGAAAGVFLARALGAAFY